MVQEPAGAEGGKLIGAIRHWLGGASNDDLFKDAEAYGVILPKVDRDYKVWPENWESFNLFMQCATQWRVGPGGIIGLDYVAVQAVMGWNRLHDEAACFRDLQVMEREVLLHFNRER